MRRNERTSRERVTALMARELERFERSHRRSRELHERAERSLLSGVPMNWMTRWPGGYPIFFEVAEGAHVRDVDGHDYDDFCLGDTGAMSGHSAAATVRALGEQGSRGITTMLPATYASVRATRCGRASGFRAGSSRYPRPTQTGSWSGSAARSRAVRRSLSTTTATTAASTRPW